MRMCAVRPSINKLVGIFAETIPLDEPIYEFGSFQVPGRTRAACRTQWSRSAVPEATMAQRIGRAKRFMTGLLSCPPPLGGRRLGQLRQEVSRYARPGRCANTPQAANRGPRVPGAF